MTRLHGNSSFSEVSVKPGKNHACFLGSTIDPHDSEVSRSRPCSGIELLECRLKANAYEAYR